MKRIHTPDGKTVDFPDDTPDQEIERALSEFSSQKPQSPKIDSRPTPTIPKRTEIPDSGYTTWPQLKDKAIAFGDELAAESPVLAGAGLAAYAASPGGPMAMIPAAVVGGTTAALAKEGVEQGLLRSGVIDEGEKLISDYPVGKKDVGQMFLDAGMTGLEMGAGELTGQALIGPFSKMARGSSRSVTPEGRETLEFFKSHPESGIVPNPAKVTDSRALDIASNAGEASIFGGEEFMRGQIDAVHFMDNAITKMVDKTLPDKQLLGDMFADAIGENLVAFKATAKNLFDGIDNLVGENFVNTKPLSVRANRLLDELSGLKVEPGLLKKLEDVGRESVGATGDIIKGMRFSEAQGLRSDLLSIIRSSSDTIPNKTIGRAKILAGLLEDQMSAVAEKAGATNQWRKANKFWKDGKKVYEDTVIKKILEKDPDYAVNALFNATKDRAVMVKRIKSALGNKERIHQFQDNAMGKIIFNATDPATGEIKPKSILTALKQFGGADGKALKAMWPHGEDKMLSKLARIKNVIIKHQPDSTGRFAVQIGQITALGALASGHFKGTAATILIAPYMIAKAFRNPHIVRLITEGAKSRPGLKQSVSFTTRLAAMLSNEGIPYEWQDPKQISEVPSSGYGPFDRPPKY